MKKLLIIALVLLTFVTMASAQKQAEIKFDKLSVDLGTFPKSDPIRIHKHRRRSFSDQSSYGQLRMHSAYIHQNACNARTKR